MGHYGFIEVALALTYNISLNALNLSDNPGSNCDGFDSLIKALTVEHGISTLLINAHIQSQEAANDFTGFTNKRYYNA
jgi:hypothetical protein